MTESFSNQEKHAAIAESRLGLGTRGVILFSPRLPSFPMQLCISCLEEVSDRHYVPFKQFRLMALTEFIHLWLNLSLIRRNTLPSLSLVGRGTRGVILFSPRLPSFSYAAVYFLLRERLWSALVSFLTISLDVFGLLGFLRSFLGSTHVFGSLWLFVLDVFSVSVKLQLGIWIVGGVGEGEGEGDCLFVSV